jgi:type I restriction enzyme R subunit
MQSESITRKEIIDLRLKEAGWSVSDPTQVIEEYFLSPSRNDDNATDLALDKRSDKSGPREFSDYVLLGKNGKPVAVVEAKQSSKSAELGREQAKQYCQNIQANHDGELPFCFYTNGHEIFFWNLGEAPTAKGSWFPHAARPGAPSFHTEAQEGSL